jgi:hypothetical protein
LTSKKRRLRPQNGSGSSGPKKLLKIVNYAETEKLKEAMVGGPSGIGGWPPIFTWIRLVPTCSEIIIPLQDMIKNNAKFEDFEFDP